MGIPQLYFRAVLVFWIISGSGFAAVQDQGNITDRLVLLDFKKHISDDPFQIMMSWNDSVHFCVWTGVTCDPSNQRVLILNLRRQKLVGSVPPSIGNITFLTEINLSDNSFHGGIPQEIGRLLHLQRLNLTINAFYGSIPTNISHCRELRAMSMAYNKLVGNFPGQLNSLTKMRTFRLSNNNLTGGFPTWIANFSALKQLSLADNPLEGNIPPDLGRLTRLTLLSYFANQLVGTVPSGIFNISSLRLFSLTENRLQGELPPDVGTTLPNLVEFYGALNQFTGEIPASLANASNLYMIEFGNNGLTGTLPSVFGKLQSLYGINFEHSYLGSKRSGDLNFLSDLANCTGLEVLALRENDFGGELPNSVGKLVNLNRLDLSDNKLSGEIPTTISSCLSLESLILRSNLLQGRIPESMKALRGLGEMDLSQNNFSGEIPEFIGKFSSLKKLNLSFNNFVGKVSNEGIFANASAVSVAENKKLCGGIPDLHLPNCPNVNHKSKFPNLKVLVPTSISVVFLVTILTGAVFYARKKSRKKASVELSSSKDGQIRVSYHEVFHSTDGFSANNLIGSGSFGSVYKGVLGDDGLIVAVKILNLEQRGASRSFIDECNVLRSTRHRNLLKIVTVCSSIDLEGNDFKCIISEFMSNGNIDQWLHPANDDLVHNKCLTITQRLDIALDVASAMDYLHNCCEIPIVHCNLKPSNVLLDEDMTAHVGDFGLSKFLFEDSTVPQKNSLSEGLKGSIGYIPPKYGLDGRVSTVGDVYSYGILLLELFTGKRPTDDIFGDGISIYEYVEIALSGHVMEVIDPSLLLLEEGNDENESGKIEETSIVHANSFSENRSRIEEILVSILSIGLECSKSLPGDRMPVKIALRKLQKSREKFCEYRRRN